MTYSDTCINVEADSVTSSEKERGAVLLIAMLIVTMLTLVGSVILSQVAIDTESVGIELSAVSALQIAEAGIHHGLDELEFTFGMDPSDPHAIVDLLPSFSGDADCPAPGCKLLGWKELHSSMVTHGPGEFRVVVQKGGVGILVIRSLGVVNGAKRLIEVELMPES